MTILNTLTNDDWWGVFELGVAHSNKWGTFLFIITMVYIINYMTFGFVFAILLEGFTQLKISDENTHQEEEENEAEEDGEYHLTSKESQPDIEREDSKQ